MYTQSVLFQLLRIAVCGEAVTEQLKTACTPEMLEAVYDLAARHDLAHLVGQAASKLDLADSEILEKCKKTAMHALMRYMQLNYEYEQVCQVLEQEKIPFIPLKGSVLRNDYPEPWMRTSCDVDILQQELIGAGVLPADYDFEAHKQLVPMQPGDVPVTYADTSALEADFGFRPNTSLRDGLRKFAQWYKEFYL